MSCKKLIDVSSEIKNKFLRVLYGVVKYPLEAFLCFNKLNMMYAFLQRLPVTENFFERAIKAIGISYEIDEQELAKIPQTGSLVVVSNHQLGGLDGIILGAMLNKVRPDTKVVVNGLLDRMVEIKPYVIEVNPFGGKAATAQNVSAMKSLIKTLKDGGCVATFPSGTVSYLHLRDMCISDPEWNKNIANIARKTGASILPVYFEGRNSWLFYLAGLIHPLLRTVMLPREMVRLASKKPVRMRVGSVISPRRVSEFETDQELTAWLRISSYVLGGRDNRGEPQSKLQLEVLKRALERLFVPQKEMKSLINPISPDLMQREIDALPESACMINGEKIAVYCAEAWQIKWTLIEIGRLRERTFRDVGEGTGKSMDTDEFDQYYLHMFMWDKLQKCIVGAYRIGRTDKIMDALGVQGLYASTLFKIQDEFVHRINPALEMGRSFIVSEYQKKRSTLAILWRGIGEFLYRNPQYRTLYGPVSISTNYNAVSKDLIVEFLTEQNSGEELAKYVKAKMPPKVRMKEVDKRVLRVATSDIEHISALVSEIDIDNKGIPTLLKHYLKLDGKLIAFNVDPDFSSCIDGLIVVDILNSDPKMIKSYMGAEQMASYRKYHGLDTPSEV
ncbi:MAG: lysophospholipid acyltransferase family protein [Opitutales bacterium]|nr:lysophospholipid acyltransferase family protein [Opitutales bacterium]